MEGRRGGQIPTIKSSRSGFPVARPLRPAEVAKAHDFAVREMIGLNCAAGLLISERDPGYQPLAIGRHRGKANDRCDQDLLRRATILLHSINVVRSIFKSAKDYVAAIDQKRCVVFSGSNLFRRKAAARRGCPEMRAIIIAACGVHDLFAISRDLKFQNAKAGENLLAVSRAQINPDEVSLLRTSIVARQGASSSSASLQKI